MAESFAQDVLIHGGQSMNIQTLTKKAAPVLMMALAIGLTGCGKGFSAASNLSNINGGSSVNDGSGAGTGGSTPADTAFKNYPTDVMVNGGAEDQREVVEIDKVNKLLIVHLPISGNPFLSGMELNVPLKEIPGATLAVGPNADGSKTEVTLTIPLEHVLRGIDILPTTRLPNGDPIPAVPDGELPSLAVQLSRLGNVNATVYLAPTVVGVFVNSPISLPLQLTFPLKNKARTKTWGFFSTVPAKGNYQGGFFISVKLPDDLARIIDDVL
jgi:hypothetical protein